MCAGSLTALLLSLALPGGAAAGGLPVYRSPGYQGVSNVPKTLAPQPLPPITLGTNARNPQVLVDDAGTAHIVWTEAGMGGPDATRYCRLRRGSKSCDNPPLSLVPAQPGDPQFNQEYYPRILRVGSDIAIISHRFPNVTPKPDGSESSDSTYLWLSTDGGNTFGDPVLVGDQEPSGDAVVFGSSDNPRIGLISDTETGGTFFQALSPGLYSGAKANLDEGDPNRAYGGALAAVGDGLLAAFSDAGGQAYVRAWSGAGNPNDPAAWSPSSSPFAGSEPRLASGPSGTFLMSRPALVGAALQVRRLTGTSAGTPTKVSDTPDAGRHVLFEDAGGTLLASWVNHDRPDVRLRTSPDGSRWTPDQVLAAGGQNLDQIALGAAFDGGGFATWVRNGSGASGEGTLQAVHFGNQGPTGRPGLGSLPGGSTDPSVVETCQRIAFGVVSVLAQQGCFLTAATQTGVRVSAGPVRINGIDVIPDSGSRILINARARTIDTTGPVSIQLTPLSDTPVEIFHGELHTKLPSDGALASAADGPSPHGTILASFDTKTFPVSLKGFPVQGNIAVELVPGGTRIPISLELPKVFGGVTGDAELATTEADGLKLNSLHIEAKTIPIGPIFITDLLIDYKGGSEDTWTGGATLVLPPPGAGAKIGAQVTFKGGAFKEGSIVLGPPFPGISIAPATFLTEIGGGFGVDPLSILVRAHIGAIPIAPPNNYTVGVTGTMKVTFGSPVTFELDGTGDLFDIKLNDAHVLANTDGYLHVNGSAQLDLDVLSVDAELDAFINAPQGQFGARVAGHICIGGVCSAGGEAVVSNKGIGACITEIVTAGFGYHWGDPLTAVKLMFGSCDLTPYTIPAPGAARVAQAAHFTVLPGTSLTSIKVTGDGGPPNVTLVSPSGQSIVPVAAAPGAAGASAYALIVPSQSATYLALRNPAAGSWSVEATPGSPAIQQLALATSEPPPTVTGRVTGSGARRSLVYKLAGGEGLRATFSEIVGGQGSRVIGTATAGHGAINFTPAYGPGGPRRIEALVERNGLPRARVTVTTYAAPTPQRPGQVTGLRISRRGTTLRVSWQPAARTSFYLVRINLSNGRRDVRMTGSAVRSLTLPGIATSSRASVTVTAVDVHGRPGPAAAKRE